MTKVESKVLEMALDNAIYLIESRQQSFGVIYKVLVYDSKVHFCYVGLECYSKSALSDGIIKNIPTSEHELLPKVKSFYILLSDIEEIVIDAREFAIDNIPNIGVVRLRDRAYFIHEANDIHKIRQFFRNALSIPITDTKETIRKENQEHFCAEHDNEQSKKLRRLIFLSYVLLIILFATFFPSLTISFIPFSNLTLILIAINAAIPPFVFIVYLKNTELFSNDELKFFAVPLVLHPILLAIIAVGRYQVIYTTFARVLIVVLSVAISLLLLFIVKIVRKNKSSFSSLSPLLLIAIYSFGILIHTNCIFDFAEPQRQLATVERKIPASSRTPDRFYVSLEDGSGDGLTIYVSQSIFRRMHVDDQIYVYVKPGLWRMRWVTNIHFP